MHWGQQLYPKPKRSLCFHSRPNVAVCFQSGRLHAPQTILNILRGTHYTLLCKVAHNYKTITPKYSPKTPKAVWGFSFRCETATKCQGRRNPCISPLTPSQTNTLCKGVRGLLFPLAPAASQVRHAVGKKKSCEYLSSM